jgi:lambda family phage minor tail protein L
MSMKSDVQKLEPGNLIRLFELDLSNYSGGIQRFHGHMQQGEIIWQGETYSPVNVDVSGMEMNGGKTVAPTLTIGNMIDGTRGAVSALCLYFNDFVGSKLTVHETFAHYLDADNFPDGNPTASDSEVTSTWYIEQKTSENVQQVQFELASPASYADMLIPTRQITNRCTWCVRGEYRGDSCGYTGGYVDKDGNPTTDPALDKCSGLIDSGCKPRFGEDAELPFGGFPSAGLLR